MRRYGTGTLRRASGTAASRGSRPIGLAAVFLLACGAAACSPTTGYWNEQLAALPDWQAFRCKQAMQQSDFPMVKSWCPRGMPFP